MCAYNIVFLFLIGCGVGQWEQEKERERKRELRGWLVGWLDFWKGNYQHSATGRDVIILFYERKKKGRESDLSGVFLEHGYSGRYHIYSREMHMIIVIIQSFFLKYVKPVKNKS